MISRLPQRHSTLNQFKLTMMFQSNNQISTTPLNKSMKNSKGHQNRHLINFNSNSLSKIRIQLKKILSKSISIEQSAQSVIESLQKIEFKSMKIFVRDQLKRLHKFVKNHRIYPPKKFLKNYPKDLISVQLKWISLNLGISINKLNPKRTYLHNWSNAQNVVKNSCPQKSKKISVSAKMLLSRSSNRKTNKNFKNQSLRSNLNKQ